MGSIYPGPLGYVKSDKLVRLQRPFFRFRKPIKDNPQKMVLRASYPSGTMAAKGKDVAATVRAAGGRVAAGPGAVTPGELDAAGLHALASLLDWARRPRRFDPGRR